MDASCPPLRKLRMLMEVLDAPMKQIVTLWERREMQVKRHGEGLETEGELLPLLQAATCMGSRCAPLPASPAQGGFCRGPSVWAYGKGASVRSHPCTQAHAARAASLDSAGGLTAGKSLQLDA